ncbi:MAG TPA: M28 family peptidase, partial [Fimbriimonas sp.]|nr:M28 family peptidase [Fimbriimonas sp.]
MGQVANPKHPQGQNDRKLAARQALRGLRVTLVGAVAAATIWACAQQQQTAPTPAPVPARQAFDENRSWLDLTKQLGYGVRAPGSVGHLKTRDYIADELKKTCENVRFQEFTHKWSRNGQTVKMWNVIGEQNWKKAKVRVLLLAHWDTRPTADQEWDRARAGRPILGANDGASGVAVLLELARVLKVSHPEDLGIMYLFTDGEDLGPGLDEMFLGAVHFSKNLPSPPPMYGILLDMIGDKDLVVPMEPNSRQYAPELMDAFYAHAEAIGLGKTFP